MLMHLHHTLQLFISSFFTLSSVIFFRKEDLKTSALTGCYWSYSSLPMHLLICLLNLHSFQGSGLYASIQALLWSSLLFFRKLNREMPYFKLIKGAIITGIILSSLGIICNLIGRFSLAGIFGISAIFAVTQAVILPLFIETIIEIILLQLQNSRIRKGFLHTFDSSIIVKKGKNPSGCNCFISVVYNAYLQFKHLSWHYKQPSQFSSLRLYQLAAFHSALISVLYFFAIIWFAHILQQLLSFLFGETGVESEDVTPVTKKQHSPSCLLHVCLFW